MRVRAHITAIEPSIKAHGSPIIKPIETIKKLTNDIKNNNALPIAFIILINPVP